MPALSRRELLRSAGLITAGSFVAACAARPASGGPVVAFLPAVGSWSC
jgi:hypothetical protein